MNPATDLGITDTRALDEIARVVDNRVGDPDIANAIALRHIENILATTGRTAK